MSFTNDTLYFSHGCDLYRHQWTAPDATTKGHSLVPCNPSKTSPERQKCLCSPTIPGGMTGSYLGVKYWTHGQYAPSLERKYQVFGLLRIGNNTYRFGVKFGV